MGIPHRTAIASAMFFLCMLGGCSGPAGQDPVAAGADPRIDCDTPGEDIQKLADERSRKAAAGTGGAATVAPDPEVVRIMGVGDDALRRMTPAEYSQSIGQRMEAIRRFCLPNVQCPHWVIRSMC